MRPFSTVMMSGFVDLLKYICPDYSIPSEYEIKLEIDKLYEETKKKV